MTNDEVKKAIKAFVENEPLLTPTRIVLDEPTRSPSDFIPHRIQRRCTTEECRDQEHTTWAVVPNQVYSSPSFSARLRYRCMHCNKSQVEIWCHVDGLKTEKRREGVTLTNSGTSPGVEREYFIEFDLLKVGQWPPWAPTISKRLEKNLGDNLDLFRRAVACIRQSWGLGACVYMRRVIENETDRILILLEKAADGDAAALTKLAEARASQRAKDKLELAKELVPKSLRPGGVNPLAKLFGAFSEGVHELSDDEALKLSRELLSSFIYFFENFREHVEQSEKYAKTMNALGNPG